MKLLLNDKEIAHFLNSLIDLNNNKEIELPTPEDNIHTREITNDFADRDAKRKKKAEKTNTEYIPQKYVYDSEAKIKFYQKIKKAVEKDLYVYIRKVKNQIKEIKERNFHGIHKNIENIIAKLGKENILQQYQKSNFKDFVKGTGNTLTKTPQDRKSVV